jgi:hypothetical protein
VTILMMYSLSYLVLLLGALLPAVRGDAVEVTVAKRAVRPNPSNGHWIDTWASMPQLTEPANLPPAPFVCSRITHELKG